tara:strand:- start:2896 stop:3471 length:576 start_codon:yes stop_codon:yes gene_type:complete
MEFFIRFIFIGIMVSCLYPASKKHFTDQQIANMVPQYFNRDHNSPNITRIRVYGKEDEKYLHLEIDVNRNRYLGEMDYTLFAMANITQYAKVPFDKFIVIMYPAIKSNEPELLEADAGCTINYLIHKKTTRKRWSETCVKISTDFENFVVPTVSSPSKKESSSDESGNKILLLVILAFIGFLLYFLKRKTR